MSDMKMNTTNVRKMIAELEGKRSGRGFQNVTKGSMAAVLCVSYYIYCEQILKRGSREA
jgi:hypothetical protein